LPTKDQEHEQKGAHPQMIARSKLRRPRRLTPPVPHSE
jgi:hypothetical protein